MRTATPTIEEVQEQDEIVTEIRDIDNELPEYSGAECLNDPNYVDF